MSELVAEFELDNNNLVDKVECHQSFQSILSQPEFYTTLTKNITSTNEFRKVLHLFSLIWQFLAVCKCFRNTFYHQISCIIILIYTKQDLHMNIEGVKYKYNRNFLVN